MCGIAGVVQFRQRPLEEPVVQGMVRMLMHRGPDGSGTALPRPWAGLGHTRLKVIDLSPAAAQPMASRDRALWIVFNGEIYNYRALRAELQTFGRAFASGSDTEVVLQAYEQWGEECVHRLDGMFAFAIFDDRRQRLLLARDRTGKKPLFYYRDQHRFVFASEIKALLAHPDVPVEFEPSILPRYFAYGYVPSPQTFYAGIRSLPPAALMTVMLPEGRERERVYWQMPEPEAAPVRIAPEEAVSGVRDRLSEAVRKRLMSDVPLGAFLSGGLDSTIIVGLMSRLSPAPVHTFSIGFRGDPAYDETPFARLASERFGTTHTEFMVEPQAFELLEQLVHHHDQPFGDASALPAFLLCRLAKEHITVALNGDGGDELFAGYRRFQAAVWSERAPRWSHAAAAWTLRHLPEAVRRRPEVQEALRFADVASRPWEQRLVRWTASFPPGSRLIRPELLRRLNADDWVLPARRHLSRASRGTALAQSLYLNFHEYLPGDLHVKMDRCSMAHGLETRSPFLDTALIEYAAQLPDAFKLRGRTTKWVLRHAFAELLPPAIQRRGKRGFAVPLDAWFRGELRETVSAMLLGRDAHIARYLDPAAVQACVDAHVQGAANRGLSLWSLLTLEVWLRMLSRRAQAPRSLEAASHE